DPVPVRRQAEQADVEVVVPFGAPELHVEAGLVEGGRRGAPLPQAPPAAVGGRPGDRRPPPAGLHHDHTHGPVGVRVGERPIRVEHHEGQVRVERGELRIHLNEAVGPVVH
ncbi:MAG: hypothetical protein ACK559_25110, partial [bacterium]